MEQNASQRRASSPTGDESVVDIPAMDRALEPLSPPTDLTPQAIRNVALAYKWLEYCRRDSEKAKRRSESTGKFASKISGLEEIIGDYLARHAKS